MSNEVTVSIICNTFNHERYIAQALDSFLMQRTKFKFEILVHDDASTDKTANIVRGYERKYPNIVKPIYQNTNQYSQWISPGFKYQYPRAQGKYLAFCEGDDYWTDEFKLQKQVEFLEKNEAYIACVHRYIVVDENGKEHDTKTFGYYPESESGDYNLNDFEIKELPGQLASLVMRNIICDSDTGYPESFTKIHLQGDIRLYLYLLAHGVIYRMPEVMSAYRFVRKADGTSWSSRDLKEKVSYERWKELRKLEKEFYREYGRKINLQNRRAYAAARAIYELLASGPWYRYYRIIYLVAAQKGIIHRGLKEAKRKMSVKVAK